MKVMYIRCSTEEQNEARQVEAAKELGIEKLFIDKASGKNRDRTFLKEMLNYVREGDTVYCSDISRIARNTKDLLNIIEELNNKGVFFVSLKENIDTSTPTGKFMLTVFGAIAELERENILSRQREGIEIARKEGKYKGRKRIDINEDVFKQMVSEWNEGKRTASSIYKYFNISSQTFYRRANELNRIEEDRKDPKPDENLGDKKITREGDYLVFTDK